MAEQQEVDDLLLPFHASLRISSPEAEGGEPPETVAAAADGGVEVSGPAAAPSGSAAKEAAVVPDGRDDAVVDSESSRTGVHLDEESVAGAGSVGPRTEVPGTLDPKVVSESERGEVDVGEELCHDDANRLFSMLFGEGVSKEILLRWTNQGIRFSSDPDTCIGLVQQEGGPCGVLAALQAFVLKYLLFFPKELDEIVPTIPQADFGERRVCQSLRFKEADFSAFTNNRKTRALLLSMVEILFLCGSKKRAAIAILCVPTHQSEDRYRDRHGSEMISNALESFSIESASDLQKYLRISIYTSQLSAFHCLEAELPVFGSQIGALLFLISALLSRGFESIQADRDDPSLPLVTAPFGHASQEIVNLLLCGKAVPNLCDGQMDFGGMLLNGVPDCVEIGFLTLLESGGHCEVGQFLKHPRWPIWVVGSGTHYTVLFAPDTTVQDENELEEWESKVRAAFDSQDQSGGGGYISVEGFHEVLRQTNINMPADEVCSLSFTGIVLWSDFRGALLDLAGRNPGVAEDLSRLTGQKQFDIYHFNGLAKSVLRGAQAAEDEAPPRRPRFCKLHVSVPSKWTQTSVTSTVYEFWGGDWQAVPYQPSPLVDCIRTRWPHAMCRWVGDSPSIE